MKTPLQQEEQLLTLTQALSKSVSELFKERGGIEFSRLPEIKKEKIVEYKDRMRVFGLEKFPRATYVSTVNYYLNEKDMEKNKAWGALVIFVEQEYIGDLLKSLRYPQIDDLSEDAMLDACGALANIIAGRFKTAMLALGLIKLEMSAFSNYRNSAPAGVAFHPKQHEKYEINFYIHNEKRLVAELTMAPVPSAS